MQQLMRYKRTFQLLNAGVTCSTGYEPGFQACLHLNPHCSANLPAWMMCHRVCYMCQTSTTDLETALQSARYEPLD